MGDHATGMFLSFVREAQSIFLPKPLAAPVPSFLEFVAEAQQLLSPPTPPSSIAAFGAFVAEAEPLLASLPHAAAPPSREFEDFVKLAMPLAVDRVKAQLPDMIERAQILTQWFVPFDLLSLGGFSFVENYYTALMKWALDPETHSESALRRQRAWIRKVGIDDSYCRAPCVCQAQVYTSDGIPDLVLQYDEATIVVEAKTGSAEHTTPSGGFQTDVYPKAVRTTLRLPPEHKVFMVFITTDGTPPHNPDAKATKYFDFVMALAEDLDRESLPEGTRFAYSMLFTHLLRRATDCQMDLLELLQTITDWSKAGHLEDNNDIAARLDTLAGAARFLLPRVYQ
jgi:hypothetical protein